jgi:hypothetical protein
MDAAGIDTAIVKIRGNSQELQALIHTCAVSLLAHISVHGDTRQVVKLMTALPTAQRRETLALWFKTYSSGKLKLSLSKDAGWVAKLDPNRMESDFKIEAAAAMEYGDLVKEPVAKKPTDLKALIAAITKFTKSDLLEDGTPKNPPEIVAAAQKAMKALTA